MSMKPSHRSGALPTRDHWACLGLGSNVVPESHIPKALRRLRRAVTVEAVSTAWESPAVGSDGPDYVNAALLVRTPLPRQGLLARLKSIEDQLGRVRTRGRPVQLTIDIDIVIFDGEVLEDDLWGQAFRAMPVAELLPDLCRPSSREPLLHVATRLAGATPIRPRPDILPGPPRTRTSRTRAADSTRTSTP